MRQRRRDAFTLIELIVAMGIIVLLGALVWMIGPSMQRQERASRGAQLLQGQLFIAKQTALRDRILYGIRLLPGAGGNLDRMQYITQPQDYVRNRVMIDPNSTAADGTRHRIFFEQDITDGLTDPMLWAVQLGDYLQIQNEQQPKLIVRVVVTKANVQTVMDGSGTTATSVTAPDSNYVETQSGYLPWEGPYFAFSTDFRVMRSPRPVPGEAIIELPEDVIIEPPGPAGSYIDANPTTGRYDIMFTPSGAVSGSAARRGKVILWVRDTGMNKATGREQTLIVVFTRSGAIASYPVDVTPGGDPYSFTFDPRPDGM